jgi:membrane protease YdiL (CAAX protease family)
LNTNSLGNRRSIIPIAWRISLFASHLPDIIFYEWIGRVPGWLAWGKLGILVAFLALCYFWKEIRSLWQIGLVLCVFYCVDILKLAIWNGTWFKDLMGTKLRIFASGQILWEIFDLAAALIILAVVWAIKHRPGKLFLVKGDFNANVEPVRWLFIKEGTSVRKFGMIFLLISSVALIFILAPGTKIPGDSLNNVVPLIPSVLFVAALNSLGEEISFRISHLSTTVEVLGRNQAVWLAAIFFGLAHYIGGQPSGIPGVLATTFLGWGFGKCLTESKTILFPWFLHFVMNSIIFFFNTLGTIL